MKKSLPSIAFFSIRFMSLLCLFASLIPYDAYAQSVAASPAATATTHGVKPVGVPTIGQPQIQPVGQLQPLPAQIAPQPAMQLPLKADVTIVTPVGGETFVNGNRTPISWHANVPEIPDAYKQRGYKLMGELRLIDQSPNKKDLRIAFLTEQDLAKGTYQFLPGSQTEMTYGHTAAGEGQYKVWIYIKGIYDCGPNAKCAPLFEAQAITQAPITIKYR
ncbi:MAG: hypothetical protein SFW65_04160 [Alphaproteobacteria bacterium]|nr:hypothetical protein [Alphaproteobacteria bacterium]